MASKLAASQGYRNGARPKMYHIIERDQKTAGSNRKSQHASRRQVLRSHTTADLEDGNLYDDEIKFSRECADQNVRNRVHSRRRQRCNHNHTIVDTEDGHLDDDEIKFLLECADQNILLEGLIIQAARKHNIASVIQQQDRLDIAAVAEFADVDGDVFVLLDTVRSWVNQLRTTSPGALTAWLSDNSLDRQRLEKIENQVQKSYHLLKHTRNGLPSLNFRANLGTIKNSITDILLRTFAAELCTYAGHDSLGYRKLATGTLVRLDQTSVLRYYARRPRFVIPLITNSEPNPVKDENEVISHPKVSVTGSLLLAVPQHLALDALLEQKDKAANDITKETTLERMEVHCLGHVTTERLVKRWQAQEENSLGNKARKICCKDSGLVVELHHSRAGFQVYCHTAHHEDIRGLLEAETNYIRKTLASEVVCLPYPDHLSKTSISVGPGMQCKGVLFPGESQHAVIKAIPGVETTWHAIVSTLENFTGIESYSTKGENDEAGVFGYLSMTSSDALRELLAESQKRSFSFSVTQQMAYASLEQPMCYFSDNLSLRMTWRVHTDRYSKPRVSDGDEARVRATVCRVLEDLSEDKVMVKVIARPEDKKRGVVRAHVSFADHVTAHRGVDLLHDLVSGDLPVQIDNMEEVDNKLKSLTLNLTPQLYSVLKATVTAKLENFRLSTKYRAEYKVHTSADGRVRVEVRASTLQACVEIRARLKETVTATGLKVSRWNDRCLTSRHGNAFIRLVERQTNTCITIRALSSELLIYGNRVNRTNAIGQLQAYLAGDIQTSFIIDFRGDGLPNDFLLSTAPNEQCTFLGHGEIFFQPSLTYESREEAIKALIEAHGPTAEPVVPVSRERNPPVARTCVSCFVDVQTEDDFFVLEGCGHLYCSECLTTQVDEAIKNTSFPVLCAHDSQPISAFDFLNIITRFRMVSAKRFLSACVRDFVGSNPDTYRFCCRLNCPGVCRRHKTQLVDCLACGFCSKKLCPKCLNSYHKFLTCEEAAADTFKLYEWINEQPKRRKKCPSCKIGIEKLEGCNRITCASCNTNICWVCMKFYPTSHECYDHLNKEHGGYG